MTAQQPHARTFDLPGWPCPPRVRDIPHHQESWGWVAVSNAITSAVAQDEMGYLWADGTAVPRFELPSESVVERPGAITVLDRAGPRYVGSSLPEAHQNPQPRRFASGSLGSHRRGTARAARVRQGQCVMLYDEADQRPHADQEKLRATMDFRKFTQDYLARLNSATKYPSILTYHAMGEKGRLTEELTTEFTGAVQVTEKIDGTNARIIVPPTGSRGVIIGSREELLHHTDDLIHNPSQGIVNTLYSIFGADAEPTVVANDTHVTVIFGEVYGGKVTAGSKQYTSTGATGFRVFDIAIIPPEVLDLPVDQIAAWRDHGGQEFLDTLWLALLADKAGFTLVPEVPVAAPPAGVGEALAWLEASSADSVAALDDGAGGHAEGVVVRNLDRSSIAKLRFEDYRRTLRVSKR